MSFSFSSYNTSSYSILVFMISEEKSTVSIIENSSYIMSTFLLLLSLFFLFGFWKFDYDESRYETPWIYLSLSY